MVKILACHAKERGSIPLFLATGSRRDTRAAHGSSIKGTAAQAEGKGSIP